MVDTVASYVWIPRVKDIMGGTDNSYLPLPPGNDCRFFSDTPSIPVPPLPGQTYFRLVLPPDFPRKVRFTRIMTVYQLASFTTAQIVVWVDPKGISYATGTPPGAEIGSDVTRQIQMAIWEDVGAVDAKDWIMPVPVLFDRDAGDKLTVDASSPGMLTAIGVCFEYLVPIGVTMPGSGLGNSRPLHFIGAANTTPVLVQTGYVEAAAIVASGLAAAYFLKLFDAPTVASVTMGTTVPVMTIPVPAGAGANVTIQLIQPVKFLTGLVWAATANAADADNTATAGGQVINFLIS